MMKSFSVRMIYWRVCVFAALVAAGIVVPLAFAVIPWLMLAAYIYLLFRPVTEQRLSIPFHLLVALSLPLFFEPVTGKWLSPLLVLPVLPLLDDSLRQFAAKQDFNQSRRDDSAGNGNYPRLTEIGRSLAISLGTAAAVAIVLSSPVLLLSAGLVFAYLAASAAISLVSKSEFVITNGLAGQRIVAGHSGKAPIILGIKSGRTPLAGYLYLHSQSPWFSVVPAVIKCGKPEIELESSFTPPFAGPAAVVLNASYIDPLGLVYFDFILGGLELLVIPRARYAEWMARKYLELSRGGSLQITDSFASSSHRASRQGIEFYGLRQYQPGDTARSIDWKHTSKLRQVIVKEFVEKNAECTVIAVNLAVGSEQEKDKLVSDFIITALTLARENIPSAIAAYNHREVVKTTPLLDPRHALLQALNLIQEFAVIDNLRRYLAVPDAERLRGNLRRLKTAGTGPAERLAELLQMEYFSLEDQVKRNPAGNALSGTLAFMKAKPNIILISARNHDAVALSFNRHILAGQGYRFIE